MSTGRLPSTDGGIQPTVVDAKGDLLVGVAADSVSRLAVGNNGETLVADSSASVGLSYRADWAAGKNKIINGDFNINQRNFTSTTTSQGFGFDRWMIEYGGGTTTYSAQTFTPGAAPVAGYESKNFARIVTSGQSSTSDYSHFLQRIEDVRTFAGQTVTISFWAKAASGTPGVAAEIRQAFGTGGSAGVFTPAGKVTISTSWARYSLTVAVPSISGKTIGTGEVFLALDFWISAGSDFNTRSTSLGLQNVTIDFWGVQVEAGSVATAFQTATGTLAGELAACQRYYARITDGGNNYTPITQIGGATSTTSITLTLQPPTTLRTGATSIEYANLSVYGGGSSGFGFLSVSSLALIRSSNAMLEMTATVTGATTGAFYRVQPNNAAGYIGVVAEL